MARDADAPGSAREVMRTGLENSENGGRAGQDPRLLRRLLRAKDRMDAAFARSFKEAFGVPPHRYLLTRRIERATALLRDTDLSITEIGFETGWNSLGTFGRVFRDITGESPGALRTRQRAEGNQVEFVPGCYLSAAHRPDLRIAVSEKRRLAADDKEGPEQMEVP
jgi:AraC-like DNA-binding protein